MDDLTWLLDDYNSADLWFLDRGRVYKTFTAHSIWGFGIGQGGGGLHERFWEDSAAETQCCDCFVSVGESAFLKATYRSIETSQGCKDLQLILGMCIYGSSWSKPIRKPTQCSNLMLEKHIKETALYIYIALNSLGVAGYEFTHI